MERRSRGEDRDRDSDRRGGGSGFKYRSRDPESTFRRADGAGGGNDSFLKDVVRFFKPAEGDNTIRILPPTWDDAEHYGLDIHVHYGIGPDNAAYLCLDKMKHKPCPICEERKRAAAAGDTDYADELRPQRRVLMYVLNREKERDGALAWSIGGRMDQDISSLCVDRKSNAALEIDNPDEGYDLEFTRTGTGMKTRYSGMMVARRPSPLDNDKALDFVQEHPLPEQLVFYSYDHIKQAFAGTARKGKDDDEDERPARRRAKDEDDDKPSRGGRERVRGRDDEDDDKPSRSRSRGPALDMSWKEVHDMTFRELSKLIDKHSLDVDADASRDDEELADMICAAAGIEEERKGGSRRQSIDEDDDKPSRRSRDDEDDDKPRRRGRDEDDDDKPARGVRR